MMLPHAAKGFLVMNPVEQTKQCPDCNSRPVVLRALNDRSVQINNESIQQADLADRLKQIFRTRVERVLYVTADPNVVYQRFAELIDLGRGLVDYVVILTPSVERQAQKTWFCCLRFLPTRSERRFVGENLPTWHPSTEFDSGRATVDPALTYYTGLPRRLGLVLRLSVAAVLIGTIAIQGRHHFKYGHWIGYGWHVDVVSDPAPRTYSGISSTVPFARIRNFTLFPAAVEFCLAVDDVAP